MAEMPETDDTLEQLIRGKLRNPADRDEVRKVSAVMLRRGYTWDEIRHAIERVGAEAEPED